MALYNVASAQRRRVTRLYTRPVYPTPDTLKKDTHLSSPSFFFPSHPSYLPAGVPLNLSSLPCNPTLTTHRPTM